MRENSKKEKCNMKPVKLAGLEPANVFGYFEEICSMPHGSGNTKIISVVWLALTLALNFV